MNNNKSQDIYLYKIPQIPICISSFNAVDFINNKKRFDEL